jgi:high-affinity nickel permease
VKWRALRRGGPHCAFTGRGLLVRLCRPLFKQASRSWHTAPLSFLFGLGFLGPGLFAVGWLGSLACDHFARDGRVPKLEIVRD